MVMTNRIIQVDGELADLATPVKWIARALTEQPELEYSVPPAAPQTVARLSRLLGLDRVQARELRDSIKNIPNFWLTLERLPRKTILQGQMARGQLVIYRALRFPTKGYGVADQTHKWLELQGIQRPIVWIDGGES